MKKYLIGFLLLLSTTVFCMEKSANVMEEYFPREICHIIREFQAQAEEFTPLNRQDWYRYQESSEQTDFFTKGCKNPVGSSEEGVAFSPSPMSNLFLPEQIDFPLDEVDYCAGNREHGFVTFEKAGKGCWYECRSSGLIPAGEITPESYEKDPSSAISIATNAGKWFCLGTSLGEVVLFTDQKMVFNARFEGAVVDIFLEEKRGKLLVLIEKKGVFSIIETDMKGNEVAEHIIMLPEGEFPQKILVLEILEKGSWLIIGGNAGSVYIKKREPQEKEALFYSQEDKSPIEGLWTKYDNLSILYRNGIKTNLSGIEFKNIDSFGF